MKGNHDPIALLKSTYVVPRHREYHGFNGRRIAD
jgi:hypothetical protein